MLFSHTEFKPSCGNSFQIIRINKIHTIRMVHCNLFPIAFNSEIQPQRLSRSTTYHPPPWHRSMRTSQFSRSAMLLSDVHLLSLSLRFRWLGKTFQQTYITFRLSLPRWLIALMSWTIVYSFVVLPAVLRLKNASTNQKKNPECLHWTLNESDVSIIILWIKHSINDFDAANI